MTRVVPEIRQYEAVQSPGFRESFAESSLGGRAITLLALSVGTDEEGHPVSAGKPREITFETSDISISKGGVTAFGHMEDGSGVTVSIPDDESTITIFAPEEVLTDAQKTS
jgi:hypothetical protein